MRYTDEQHNLADGMKILISLYYKLKETDRTEWMNEPMIRLVAELAYKVIPEFTTCLYLKYSFQPRLLLFRGSRGIYLTEEEFQNFINAMDAFSEDREKTTITISEISYGFKKSAAINRIIGGAHLKMPNTIYRDSRYLTMKTFIPGSREDEPAEELYTGMVQTPSYHDAIYLDVNEESSFVKSLYTDIGGEPLFLLHDNLSPYIYGGTSFNRMIIYFFARYLNAFESFERIKLCEYSLCNKLIFEMRLNERRFCDNNDVCKLANHKASQDPVKFACRGKQNRWIRGKSDQVLIKHFTVYKNFHCDNCQNPVSKGGECSFLLELNKKIFTALEEKKKLPRKRRI